FLRQRALLSSGAPPDAPTHSPHQGTANLRPGGGASCPILTDAGGASPVRRPYYVSCRPSGSERGGLVSARLRLLLSSFGAALLAVLGLAVPARAATAYSFHVVVDSNTLHLNPPETGCPAISDN